MSDEVLQRLSITVNTLESSIERIDHDTYLIVCWSVVLDRGEVMDDIFALDLCDDMMQLS